MGRRAFDIDGGAATTATDVLACPQCQGRLKVDLDTLVCPGGHTFVAGDGYFDLWPPDQPEPGLDWFATPYGLVYDTGIKERWLARLGGRAGWGTDVDRMYALMDEGVKCEPGQVVVDVPVGGAPPLRSAAGRLKGTYVGIDLSPSMLQRARDEAAAEGLDNVLLVRGDATRLPLPDHAIDRILCFNGLHVLPDKEAAMREFARVLKPGGQLWGNVVIVDRSPRARLLRPWFSRDWLFFHPADPAELEVLALENGFEWEQDAEGSMLYFRGVAAG